MKDDLKKDIIDYPEEVWIASDFDGETCVFFEYPSECDGIYNSIKYGHINIGFDVGFVDHGECKKFKLQFSTRINTRFSIYSSSCPGVYLFKSIYLEEDEDISLEKIPYLNKLLNHTDTRYYMIIKEV